MIHSLGDDAMKLFFTSNKVDMLGPERWWTILELVEVEGNSDGRP